MCLSRVYVDRNGEREFLVGEVASVEVKDGKLIIKTLFGEQKEIEANIREVNFVSNSIVLENSGG